MEDLVESSNYSAERIFEIFLKVSRSKSTTGTTYKYCDLVSGYNCSDLTSCPSSYGGPKRCSTEPDFYYPLLSDETPDYNTWVDSTFSVKTSYVSSSSLFDYVYCCRMGNGSKSTQDGSTYLGKGFIHLTGKEKYERISDAWNEKYPNDTKEFHGNDINLLETDIEVAMKASLLLWEEDGLNEIADGGISNTFIDDVGSLVNGSGSNLPNGYEERREHTKKANEVFSE